MTLKLLKKKLCIPSLLIFTFTLLLGGNATATDGVIDNYGKGPLWLSSQSPGQSLRLSATPLVPTEITPGQFSVKAGANWTNVWANGKRYFLDYEMLESNLAVTYGLSKRTMVGVTYTQRDYFGGVMDNFVEEFHDLFGFEQDGRDKHPSGKSFIRTYDANGRVTWNLDDVDSLENKSLQLMMSHILHPGTRHLPAVNLSGGVRFGLDSPFMDDETLADVSIGIGLSKRWHPRWHSYHQVSYTHFNETKLPAMELEDSGLSAMTALAWQCAADVTLLVQYQYHDGMVKNLEELSDGSHELSFGVKWQITYLGAMEFAVIENIINYDNSPDIGFHLAYSLALN